MGNALAGHAADVHQRLDAGDPLGARAEAEELAAAVDDAVARGDVPAELAPELRDAATRLRELAAAAAPTHAPSAPPPPAAPAKDGDGNGKGKGKDKDKDKGKDRDRDRDRDDDDRDDGDDD